MRSTKLKALQLTAGILAVSSLYLSAADLLDFLGNNYLPLANEISKSGISEPFLLLTVVVIIFMVIFTQNEQIMRDKKRTLTTN